MANTPEVAKKPYSTRLDEDVLKWLEEEAKRQKRTVANLIDLILAEYKESKEAKPKKKS